MFPKDFGEFGEIYGNITTHPEYHMFVDDFVSLMVDHAKKKNRFQCMKTWGFSANFRKK